jgi:hypothetical protein
MSHDSPDLTSHADDFVDPAFPAECRLAGLLSFARPDARNKIAA